MLPAFALLGFLLMFLSESAIRNGVMPRAAVTKCAATAYGKVISLPSSNSTSSSFFMQVSSVKVLNQGWRTRERVYVTTEARAPSGTLFPGVTLRVKGKLSSPDKEECWIRDHGACAILRCAVSGLHRTGRGPDPVSAGVDGLRIRLSDAYGRLYGARTAGLVEGVTMSKLDKADPAVVSDLRACGLGHIVAVSGLHVSSAAVLALALTAALGAGRRTRYAIAAAMALAVLCLSNFRVSALRATIMAGACFGGAVAARRYDSLVAVSIAGIVILCANPRAALDQSFHYSFAAALGIILVTNRKDTNQKRSGARQALAVCAGAQLGILPLMLVHGGAAPVSAVIANIMVVPAIGMLIVSALGSAMLSWVSLPLARAAAMGPSMISKYVIWVSSVCARVPGASLGAGAVSAVALCLYLAALVMLARNSASRRMVKPAIALSISLLLVLGATYPVLRIHSETSMTVLDVGEGDATLLQGRGGGTVLIDGGPEPDQLVGKLLSRGINHVDLMVATHPHSDHMAGLVEVARRMPVGRLFEPGMSHAAPGAYHDLLEAASKQNTPVTVAREGQQVTVDEDLRLEVLRAPASLAEQPENLNDCSIVAMAYIGGARVLMTGDLESEAQTELLKSHPSVGCDVIKVPHQGAANGASRELLTVAHPALATISVGRNNKFGHPSRTCLQMLAERGIQVARTDLSGDIVIMFGNGRIGLVTNRR